MNTSFVKRYRIIYIFLALTALISTMTLDTLASDLDVTEPPIVEVVSPYFSIEQRTLSDGTQISGYIINGPREPLPEYAAERASSIQPISSDGIIPDFPSYDWVFGCSAVSGAMIAGYYDRGAYPDMYTGPTNGGVMPLTDTSWPIWTDINSDTYPNNPLIASHMGVDGLATKGSIDDYWIEYGSKVSDPYIIGSWTQHTWVSAIGDFMKTSQSEYGNSDGSTTFYDWIDNPAPLTCENMETLGVDVVDGTYGRKLFYEARGYTVTDCYNQRTDNNGGGFTLAMFQAEIDAGHPVMLNLAGHTIVGYGYNGSTISIRDTWDNDPTHSYTMPWGGSYEGMELLSVSVVKLAPPAPPTMATHLPLVLRRVMPNQSPTDIQLSNSTIMENQPINTVVGTLSTVDPNAGDTATYSLVSGTGDSGNGSFNIAGNKLRSSVVFDYESQNSYSVRIRTTDRGGLYFEKAFTITITDVAEVTILNGDFEQGQVAWTEYSAWGFNIIYELPELPPHSGSWLAWLGGFYDETARISQTFIVPASASYLHYWYYSDSIDTCGIDYFRIKVNGSTVYTRDVCYANNTYGWVQATYNLAAYANTSITLMFEVTTDDNPDTVSSIFLDDVFLSSSAAAQPSMILPVAVDIEAIVKSR